MTDPHVGKLTYIRVYSGTLESRHPGAQLDQGRKERIGKIYQMHANKREEIAEWAPATSSRGHGPEGHHHRRHLCDPTTRSCSSR
jgi:elongation factor G